MRPKVPVKKSGLSNHYVEYKEAAVYDLEVLSAPETFADEAHVWTLDEIAGLLDKVPVSTDPLSASRGVKYWWTILRLHRLSIGNTRRPGAAFVKARGPAWAYDWSVAPQAVHRNTACNSTD